MCFQKFQCNCFLELTITWYSHGILRMNSTTNWFKLYVQFLFQIGKTNIVRTLFRYANSQPVLYCRSIEIHWGTRVIPAQSA